ncbi:hypothetical protein G6F68_019122 [Rhizopus microsporus]|nr:hypothetical protein G6F68_019122 [Rhizopus microsporus]
MKFIIIDQKVYDISEFVEDHPGGAQVLLTHVGKDASDVFHAMHPESAYEVLNNYFVGDIQDTPVKETASAQFALEMPSFIMPIKSCLLLLFVQLAFLSCTLMDVRLL